jgi:hypothetical protein
MKFDWYRELNNNKFYPEYHFKFSLDEDEVRKVTHKYGKNEEWIRDAFLSVFRKTAKSLASRM